MTELQDGAEGSAASLAAAVLDEEAARQEAQARAKEQVIFPDDLLPGVNSEPVGFGDAFRRGGVLMFVVLGLLVSFDQLTLNAVQTLEPELRHTFHLSSGSVVFISTASGLFYALGAVPLGWMADRMRRVPIVGIASLFGALFTAFERRRSELVHVLLDGLLRRYHEGEQHRGAPVADRRQLPDRHPGPHVGGDQPRHPGPRQCEPGARRGDRHLGGRSGRLALGVHRAGFARRVDLLRRLPDARAAARPVREGRRARRGDRGRDAGAAFDGGRVRTAEEDRDDPHVGRGVLGARLRRVRARQPAGALPQRHAEGAQPAAPRVRAQPRRMGGRPLPVPGGRVLRPGVPQGSRARSCSWAS